MSEKSCYMYYISFYLFSLLATSPSFTFIEKKKRMVLYENVEVIPQFMQPVVRIKIMQSGERVCVHSENMVLFFNPWTK